MGLKLLRRLVVVGILLFAGSAKADTVTVDGTYAFASGVYAIPPYGGTLNGQSQSFYCVDFSHDITGGMSWGVTISSLTGSDFTSTRLWSTLGSGAQTAYLEMAWLVTQMMGPIGQMQKAQDQFAIWSFTGGPNPFGTNSGLVASALWAVQHGFTGQEFEILSPNGSKGQEFLIYVPEPSELLLLLIGLLLACFVIRKRALTSVQAH